MHLRKKSSEKYLNYANLLISAHKFKIYNKKATTEMIKLLILSHFNTNILDGISELTFAEHLCDEYFLKTGIHSNNRTS